MRPSGSTAVASMHKAPAPDSARAPRWIMCQAVARPSSAEYWHIGETTMRLGSVIPRNARGENSLLMGARVKENERSHIGRCDGYAKGRCFRAVGRRLFGAGRRGALWK